MLNVGQEQKLSQQQQLSSGQLQSLALLSVPVMELTEKINEVMDYNPVLEYETFGDSAILKELPDASIEDEKKNFSDDDDSYSNDEDSWHDELPIPQENYNDSPEQIKKREFFFDNITESESMQQQLMQELNFLELDSKNREIAEAVVGGIDDTGFLVTPLGDIAQCCDAEIYEVEEILEKLQKIFPAGVGARDLKECLKLQLAAKGETNGKIFELVEYLEDFGRNRLEYLSQQLNVSMEELNTMGEKIRKLNPHPGSLFTSHKTPFIVPELTIVKGDDGFYLQDHEEFLPRLKISEEYRQMLDDPQLPPEAKAYLRTKLQEAEFFKNSLAMREKTIVRIGRFIMENQQDFLEKGVEFLRPMTMMQAAEALDLHETTVSRGCANKYISTPQGLFEFKFFFSNGIHHTGGEDVSVHAIREKIREYIENEDPCKPLSDDKISALLLKDGFKVARRTVAKYREQMHILPTSVRRKKY